MTVNIFYYKSSYLFVLYILDTNIIAAYTIFDYKDLYWFDDGS